MFSQASVESKKFFSAVVAASLIVGSFSLWSYQTRNDCVTLLVDYGALNSQSVDYQECIALTGEVTALQIMKSANFDVQGTNKYGDNVVCRLNNFPRSDRPIGIEGHEDYIESCDEMPAAFAYWAVIEKRWQIIPNPFDLNGKWAWAQTGVAELAVKAGDSLAFVFVSNGDVKFPD